MPWSRFTVAIPNADMLPARWLSDWSESFRRPTPRFSSATSLGAISRAGSTRFSVIRGSRLVTIFAPSMWRILWTNSFKTHGSVKFTADTDTLMSLSWIRLLLNSRRLDCCSPSRAHVRKTLARRRRCRECGIDLFLHQRKIGPEDKLFL